MGYKNEGFAFVLLHLYRKNYFKKTLQTLLRYNVCARMLDFHPHLKITILHETT